MSSSYTPRYYSAFGGGSRSSALVLVPMLMEWFGPRSVIDLGCGIGEWLATFARAGVAEIRGVDGDYVDRAQLAIPEEAFQTHDFAAPYRPGRRYDLAMSLEVAEHLEEAQGEALVGSLVASADVVVFSAAPPHQAGVRHINRQWPPYWSRLFKRHGYAAIDVLRPRIWTDTRVDWWYRQNSVIYLREARVSDWPALAAHRVDEPLPLVHPEMLAGIVAWGMETELKYWTLWQETHGKPGAGDSPPPGS